MTKILSLILFGVIFINSLVSLDPDFGWHIRIGEIFASRGVISYDLFSYTMPSYHFVNHEWATDIMLAKLYAYGEMPLLAFLFSLLVIAAVLISFSASSPSEKKKSGLFIIGTVAMLPLTGIRPQIITWFFFSVLIVVITQERVWKKWRWYIPAFFLLWANLHGGFFAGIFCLLVKLVVDTWKTKKLLRADAVVLFISLFVTLINPYGVSLWKEVWISLSDTHLRWSIGEWATAFLYLNIMLFLLFTLSFALFLKYRKRFSLLEKTLYLVFLFAAISSVRNAPLFVLITLPFIYKGLGFLEAEAARIPHGKKRLAIVTRVFIGIVSIFLIVQGYIQIQSTRNTSEQFFYPKKAITYLKVHPSSGNLFASYNWGGYLIWQYPEKKVFVDGRMPSWKNENAPYLESTYAFKEYEQTLEGTIPFTKTAEKYQIDTVLLPIYTEVRQNVVDAYVEKVISTITQKKETENIYEQLPKLGWKIVYKDEIAVVYRPQVKIQNAKVKNSGQK